MSKTAVLFLAAASFFIQSGEKSPRLEARILQSWSEKSVQVPLFNDFESQCDHNGNLYFHLDTGNYSNTDVLLLSADGKEGHKFTLSENPSQQNKVRFQRFSVSPSGDLYLLTLGNGQFQVFSFDDDGVSRNPVTLQVPENVDNTKFLAFDDGATLFYGFYDASGPPKLQGKSYTALFDASGKLRKELNNIVSDELPDVNKLGDLRDGAVAVGEDGNAYILSSNRITVISETGLLVRRFKVEKPDPKALAYKIYISGGSIAVVLKHIQESRVTRDGFLLVDASTGEPFGLYEPTPKIGTHDVCFSRQEGFTFLRREKGQDSIITVPLR